MPTDHKSMQFVFLAFIIVSIYIPFLTHIFLLRLCGLFKTPFSRQKGAIISCISGLIPLGFLFAIWVNYISIERWPRMFLSGFYLFSVYLLFAYVYFHIFNMSETARRIRILEEIRKIGVLKKDVLAGKYSCQDMISVRLNRLVAFGWLQKTGDKYIIKNRIPLLIAKIVSKLGSVLFSD